LQEREDKYLESFFKSPFGEWMGCLTRGDS
jgi:hypothetical protein